LLVAAFCLLLGFLLSIYTQVVDLARTKILFLLFVDKTSLDENPYQLCPSPKPRQFLNFAPSLFPAHIRFDFMAISSTFRTPLLRLSWIRLIASMLGALFVVVCLAFVLGDFSTHIRHNTNKGLGRGLQQAATDGSTVQGVTAAATIEGGTYQEEYPKGHGEADAEWWEEDEWDDELENVATMKSGCFIDSHS
jgi:hypothetical protein